MVHGVFCLLVAPLAMLYERYVKMRKNKKLSLVNAESGEKKSEADDGRTPTVAAFQQAAFQQAAFQQAAFQHLRAQEHLLEAFEGVIGDTAEGDATNANQVASISSQPPPSLLAMRPSAASLDPVKSGSLELAFNGLGNMGLVRRGLDRIDTATTGLGNMGLVRIATGSAPLSLDNLLAHRRT
jgi:hypothetical protein